MSTIIDFVMIPMLIAVMFYCWKLNKSIKILRESGTELEPVVRSISAVISHISQATEKLKSTSRDANVDFIQHIPKAVALKDDLSFLLQHGDQLIKRLEMTIDSSKKTQREIEFSAQKNRALEDDRQKNIPVRREEIIAKSKATDAGTPKPMHPPKYAEKQAQPDTKAKANLVDRGLLTALNTLR